MALTLKAYAVKVKVKVRGGVGLTVYQPIVGCVKWTVVSNGLHPVASCRTLFWMRWSHH